MTYREFIVEKSQIGRNSGFEPTFMPDFLFPFQRSLVEWAVRKGRAAIFADCGLGKGNPEGTMILTSEGFIPNDKLIVGQMVVASDGNSYRLEQIHHRGEQETFRVWFSDGASFVVDSEHLHIVRTNNDRQRGRLWRVLSTAQLLKSKLRYGKGGKSRNYEIPIVAPVKKPGRTHWIHPYIIGVILGDGCITKHCTITLADNQIIETVNGLLPDGWMLTHKSRYDYKLSKSGTNDRTLVEELRRLGIYGTRSGTKFIPCEYQNDSVENRVWLLRGLMDTDGYIKESSQFYSTSKQLADDVLELIRSLGGVPTRSLKKPSCWHKGTKRIGADCHVVTFSLKTFNPFHLARKAEKWNPKPRDNGRWIDRIEPEYRQKTICISVASPDQSYVTENHIVTHNTPMQLVWAQNVFAKTGKPVLILTPLAVGAQTVREGVKFGIECARSNDGAIPAPITITNYQRLHYFDQDKFGGVVCDECFAPNTLVSVVERGMMLKKCITAIKADEIIINASGRDRVVECHRRKVDRAVKVSVGGEEITASENHPFFTQRGWVSAVELAPGDSFMEIDAAMRLVSDGVHAEIPGVMGSEILRDILLSEMANEANKNPEKDSQSRSCSAARRGAVEMAGVGQARRAQGIGTDSEIKSNDAAGSEGEGQSDIAGDEAQTFRAWRKWNRYDETAAIALGGATRRMESGVCLVTWPKDAGLSNVLQIGLGTRREENLHRGRWSLSSFEKRVGCEENRETGFSRVDGIEVLERGHPELEQWRQADGFVYFYDLKAARHPSYAVNGLLVHNSSILKSYSGETKKAVTEFMRRIPYRLLCTATAAPNDYMELGTSSEALGYLRRVEMMSHFFNHDGGETSKWRLKKHAAKHLFWQWVCTWARAITRPSDLGFDDTGFELPEIKTVEHSVRATTANPEYLFDMPAVGLDEQRKERRRTINQRCELAAELVSNTKSAAVAWCHLNEEGHMLEKLIPGSIEIEGSDSDEFKEETFEAFSSGKIRVLVSKPVIAGFGLNWQHCAHQTFFPSHSFEQWYQAIRRCWRFGQKNPVRIDVITSEGESGVLANMNRKAEQAGQMFSKLVQLLNSELEIDRVNTYINTQEIPEWL